MQRLLRRGFFMQKFIDDLIQALYPAAELFLLLWYRAFALFYTLYGTLTHLAVGFFSALLQQILYGHSVPCLP